MEQAGRGTCLGTRSHLALPTRKIAFVAYIYRSVGMRSCCTLLYLVETWKWHAQLFRSLNHWYATQPVSLSRCEFPSFPLLTKSDSGWLVGNWIRPHAGLRNWIIREQHSTPFVREQEEVAVCHVLLARAQPALALQRLEPVLQRATTGQRWGHVIEMRLLQALAHQMLQEEIQALASPFRGSSAS